MSAATCALCLKPIVAPTKWRLSGTEVFHEACVMAYGTTGSRSNVQQLRIGELRAEIDRLRVEVDLEKARIELERRRAGGDRDRLGSELGQALSEARSYRLRMDEARRERDEATAARDAARREAQLHQTIQGPAPAPISTPEVAKDDRDSTEVRFSLLELD